MTAAKPDYTNDTTLRALDMLELLCGSLPNGLSNKAMAAALQIPAPMVTRTVATLITKGWVERTPADWFRITTRFSRLAFKVLDGFEANSTQTADMKRNYTLRA